MERPAWLLTVEFDFCDNLYHQFILIVSFCVLSSLMINNKHENIIIIIIITIIIIIIVIIIIIKSDGHLEEIVSRRKRQKRPLCGFCSLILACSAPSCDRLCHDIPNKRRYSI